MRSLTSPGYGRPQACRRTQPVDQPTNNSLIKRITFLSSTVSIVTSAIPVLWIFGIEIYRGIISLQHHSRRMVNHVAAFLGWPQGNTCQTDDDHGCQNESTSSTHSMNNRGPRTKPCGTLNYNTKVKFYEPATRHTLTCYPTEVTFLPLPQPKLVFN